jgi:hypothetical protein
VGEQVEVVLGLRVAEVALVTFYDVFCKKIRLFIYVINVKLIIWLMC